MRTRLFLTVLTVAALALASSASFADEVPVPDANGFFAFDGGKLVPIDRGFVKRKELELGKREGKKLFLGLADEGHSWKALSPSAVFVLNEPLLPADKAGFAILTWEGPQGEERSQYWQIKMWIPKGMLPVESHEHADKKGVYVFSPPKEMGTWKPGRYVAYFGETLNDARLSKTPAVFHWEIK